jgi:hypothetical protein
MKFKQRMHIVGQKLKAMKASGQKKIVLYYTSKNGKPNYRKIAITAALIAAAGYGVYRLVKHKKHRLMLQKKSEHELHAEHIHPPMM